MSEVTVTIFNHTYRLAVTAGEEDLLERCAKTVDEQMSAVQASGKVIAIDQIAVLTALELAYDAQKQKEAAALEPPKTDAAPETPAAAAKPVQSAPAQQPSAPTAPAADEAALLEEVRSLCRLCEDAIYKGAVIGMRL